MINSLLFSFFFLTIAFGQLFRIDVGNNVPIVGIDIAVFLLVAAWLVPHHGIPQLGRYTRPATILCATFLLSLTVNSFKYTGTELFVSLLYLVRFILFVFLVFVVMGIKPGQKKHMPVILLATGVFTVLAGYVQYVFYPSLRNLYYLGWDEHLYRMFSVFLDPNFAGAFFVLVFLLSLYFVFTHRNKWAYGTISLVVFVAVFLTYSRSALIMLGVSSIVFFYLLGKKRLVVGFLVVALLLGALSTQLLRSEGTNMFRVTSTMSRMVSYEEAFAVFTQHPILGIGFNAYRYVVHDIHGYKFPNHAGAGADNSFLFVLATTGVIGFAAYIYFLSSLFGIGHRALRSNDVAQKTLGAVTISSLVGVCAASFFINALFYPFIMAWLFVVVGLTENT